MTVTAMQRLPNPLQKPYIRPNVLPVKRARSMTIAAAFECEDGFVFCADRLMTHGKASDYGSFAHYGKKVFPLEEMGFGAVVCGSGDSLLISAVADALRKSMLAQPPKDASEIPAILESVLQDVSTRVGAIPDLSLLLGVAMKNRSRFIRSDGLVIQAANPTEILGIGETSLIRYLIDSVYRPEISLDELAALAAFIVFGAKTYCPQYCGGLTDICVLRNSHIWDDLEVGEKKVLRLENFVGERVPRELRNLIREAAEII
jgi:hypothetical protein